MGTPGRILQNLEKGFSADNVRFLVVDEADKLVEMGFKQVMKNIIEYLNPDRQTLLFSATRIEDVEIFNLKPGCKKISAYTKLGDSEIKNFYFLCRSDEKIKLLFNLLDGEKTIVFFSTCKTAKFYYLLFSKLFKNTRYKNSNMKGSKAEPGAKQDDYNRANNIEENEHMEQEKNEQMEQKDNEHMEREDNEQMEHEDNEQIEYEKSGGCYPTDIYLLSSNLSQNQRISIYKKFLTGNGALFCTDVGARGLDFKDVKKIIQFDCPESPETYIHRAGRSGRNKKSGTNYLFLLSSEEKFVAELSKMREKMPFEISLCEKNPGNKFGFTKTGVRMKSMVYRDRELRDFFEKYVRTYGKFLSLYKKRYDTNIEREVKSLREFFGLL